MSGISNADTFSVIDPSAQTKADHGKAAWTFLNVPPEIRRKIYQEMLVTPYKHPGPPPQLKNIYPDEAKSLEHFHIKPAFSLFFVSKQISFEAREIFYGQNTFTTFFRPTRKVYDMIETVAGYDSTKNVWVHKRNELIHAVSTIYDENYANVPEWLFGDFSPKYENGEEQLEYWMDLGEVIYKPEGLYLPAFLRKIGPTHASMITTIEIILGSLQLSTDIFPVFVETLRKHVKGLSKVVLGKLIDGLAMPDVLHGTEADQSVLQNLTASTTMGPNSLLRNETPNSRSR
ncbi:MAG: hypothetical protein LQ343_005620 [Gyalolechia ehrenbergii]|nr:MAG: hypothetical protein LQ343_005620 [Gyalolechia ehrenbergii]